MRTNIPGDGVLIEKVVSELQINFNVIKDNFTKMAEELGLPFCDLNKMYNTRLAQELGVWAESMDKGDEYHYAIFLAYFGKGKNISNKQVLADVAESIDLSRKDALRCLDKRAFQSTVDHDWKLSKEKKIVAAPTYIINQSRLVGAHPYEKLQFFIESHGAQKR